MGTSDYRGNLKRTRAAYGHSRKVRWPTSAACGCYLKSGRLHEWPPGSGRWLCQECRLAAARGIAVGGAR